MYTSYNVATMGCHQGSVLGWANELQWGAQLLFTIFGNPISYSIHNATLTCIGCTGCNTDMHGRLHWLKLFEYKLFYNKERQSCALQCRDTQ